MKQPFETARDVSEYLLECTRLPLLTGDDSSVTEFFTLPQHVETFIGKRMITTEEELKHVFRSVCNHYRKNGVTDIVRHCIEATFKSPDTVFATSETRLIRGNVLVQEPIPVFSILKFDGEKWKIFSSSYAIKDRPDHNAALMIAGRPIDRQAPA